MQIENLSEGTAIPVEDILERYEQSENQSPFKTRVGNYSDLELLDMPTFVREQIEGKAVESQAIILIEDELGVHGFACLDSRLTEGGSVATLSMRYVSPEFRRQNLGRQLRNATYRWCIENEINELESGINDVLTLDANGEVSANIENVEGTWKSYSSAAKAPLVDDIYPITEIKSVVLQSKGRQKSGVNLLLSTKLVQDGSVLVTDRPTLSLNPDDLFAYIKEEVLPIPETVTNKAIFSLIQDSGVLIATPGESSFI